MFIIKRFQQLVFWHWFRASLWMVFRVWNITVSVPLSEQQPKHIWLPKLSQIILRQNNSQRELWCVLALNRGCSLNPWMKSSWVIKQLFYYFFQIVTPLERHGEKERQYLRRWQWLPGNKEARETEPSLNLIFARENRQRDRHTIRLR